MSRKYKIFIVDDEAMVRRMIEFKLKNREDNHMEYKGKVISEFYVDIQCWQIFSVLNRLRIPDSIDNQHRKQNSD